MLIGWVTSRLLRPPQMPSPDFRRGHQVPQRLCNRPALCQERRNLPAGRNCTRGSSREIAMAPFDRRHADSRHFIERPLSNPPAFHDSTLVHDLLHIESEFGHLVIWLSGHFGIWSFGIWSFRSSGHFGCLVIWVIGLRWVRREIGPWASNATQMTK